MVAAIPLVLALLFMAVAPSEGANIGAGMFILLVLPISFLIYWLLNLLFPKVD